MVTFADTSGWYAAFVPEDAPHQPASRWLLQNNRRTILTTDYVIDETLTLLRARGQDRVALSRGRQFFAGALAEVYSLTPDDVRQTWQVFAQFADKEWSFTDCASRVVMEKRGIAQAFAFDLHFRQFGTVQVVS